MKNFCKKIKLLHFLNRNSGHTDTNDYHCKLTGLAFNALSIQNICFMSLSSIYIYL